MLIIFTIRNLYANFLEILDIFKRISQNIVDERGNMPRRGNSASATCFLHGKGLMTWL